MLLAEKIVWRFFPWMEGHTVETYKKSFESHFQFHSNLLFNVSCINDFPSFDLDIFYNWNIQYLLHYWFPILLPTFCNWKKYFSTNPETPSCILSQYLWFNKFIVIDNSYINFTNFSNKNINFVRDLENEYCNFKSWET